MKAAMSRYWELGYAWAVPRKRDALVRGLWYRRCMEKYEIPPGYHPVAVGAEREGLFLVDFVEADGERGRGRGRGRPIGAIVEIPFPGKITSGMKLHLRFELPEVGDPLGVLIGESLYSPAV